MTKLFPKHKEYKCRQCKSTFNVNNAAQNGFCPHCQKEEAYKSRYGEA